MDEFIIVLGIALFLLAVMMFAWGPQSIVPPLAKPLTNVSALAEIIVGPVGFVSSVPAKVVQINPFSAGTTQSDQIKSWVTQDITAGLFGNKEISEPVNVNKNVLGYLERVVLEFDINKEKSNSAEDLVVLWNGDEAFRGKPIEGRQAVRIPKEKVLETNAIKISTSAPGIASIVKSTSYTLENLAIAQEYGQAKVESFDLEAKDIDVFEKGEVNFAAIPRGSASGKLIVKINGFEVYNQKPDRFVLIEFDQKKIPNLGATNRVSFLAEDGFFEITDAKINIYLLTTTVVKKRSFLLTSDQLADIDNKKIRLDVEASTTKPGKLSVNLNNKTIEFNPLQSGTNTRSISVDDILEGTNTIEFTASGSFDIQKASIVAE